MTAPAVEWKRRTSGNIEGLPEWYGAGRLKYHPDIRDGLENALDAFKSLFQPGGAHKGKLMVRVDPAAD